MYKVSIIVVSDTRTSSTDSAGKEIRSFLSSANSGSTYIIDSLEIVKDEGTQIVQAVAAAIGNGVRMILTTGGTGFGIRDVTPESVKPFIVKETPGIVHLIIASSLKKTPMAALSRPIAGLTKENCLIVTLPGSAKAVKEILAELMAVFPHALELSSGGSGKEVHEKMQQEPHSHRHAHSHHHHHHTDSHSHQHLSHDPTQSASKRNRISPYPMIPLSSALSLIFKNTPNLPPTTASLLSSHPSSLIGSVLSSPVVAATPIPPWRSTNVDGYAIKDATVVPGSVYEVVTSKEFDFSKELEAGKACRVNTGGRLPNGTASVIMVEDTEVGDVDLNAEEKTIRVLGGGGSREIRSDVREGDTVLEKGTEITEVGGEIGSIVFVGQTDVQVHRRPVVGVLSTGNEISDLSPSSSSAPTSSKIYDTNRPSLISALRSLNFEVVDLGIAQDTVDDHVRVLKEGIDKCDVIVTTGGTSMGEADLLKPVVERYLEGKIHFGRVAMKPGKPTTFATLPNDTLLFALPGNPASALVTFYVFVLPCLRKMGGLPQERWQLPRVPVTITSDFKLDPRPEFHRVHIIPSLNGDGLIADSTGGQRSSRMISLAGANGLVAVPALEEGGGKTVLKKGERAEAILIGRI
ncbi:hypothetical protein BT69DRAFT_1339342 [Atractiella rhizophila]|nr:hypothetical protein BT69DRAFT_1339342 [Atractiella rhizophila]